MLNRQLHDKIKVNVSFSGQYKYCLQKVGDIRTFKIVALPKVMTHI